MASIVSPFAGVACVLSVVRARRGATFGTFRLKCLSSESGYEYRAPMRSDAIEIIQEYRTCEFTTLSRDGSPQTWPVIPLLLQDGRFLLTTSIGLPQKALNVRHNPKVSLLFSDPTGSGITKPGAVLVQGDASAADRIVTDIMSEPDLVVLAETSFARQPAGAFWSTWLGRRLVPSYYMRILIHVTPRRAYFWPTRDFASAPKELDLKELQRVG